MSRRHPATELAPFLRGDLIPTERAGVARPWERGADGGAALEAHRRLLAALREPAPPSPPVEPETFQTAVRARLQARRQGPGRSTARAWAWRRLVPVGLALGV